MPFGGLAPLPLRLGGDRQYGWPVADHARLTADLVAAMRTAPLAVFTYVKSGATVTIESYVGQNGEGTALAPTPTVNGTGDVSFGFDLGWTDEYDETSAIRIRSADANVHGSTAGEADIEAASSSALRIVTRNAGTGSAMDARATVVVKGSWRSASVYDYDAAADKSGSDTEGEQPYAAAWYAALKSAIGSKLAEAPPSGVMHTWLTAAGRSLAGCSRSVEKLGANNTPATADELLGKWVTALRIRLRRNEARGRVRSRAAAKFRAQRGNDAVNVDAVASDILGDAFVRSWRTFGADLANPPTLTYWPGVNAGPSSHDLGGGAWLSERAHYVVETTQPADMSDTDYLQLVNTDLFEALDSMLPATATFNAAQNVTTGFLLDISRMDFEGFNP